MVRTTNAPDGKSQIGTVDLACKRIKQGRGQNFEMTFHAKLQAKVIEADHDLVHAWYCENLAGPTAADAVSSKIAARSRPLTRRMNVST